MSNTNFTFECKVCLRECTADKTEKGYSIDFDEYVCKSFVVVCPFCGSRTRVSVDTAVIEIHHNNEIK